jgi:KaiC/GvpD/RAD55 family RecA-like ATPase
MDILEPQVRQLYKLLGHSEGNGCSDVRCIIPGGSPLEQEKEFQDRLSEFRKKNSREPDDSEFRSLHIVNRSIIKGEQAVVEWARKYNGRGNCYIGRTARRPDGSLHEFRTVTADIDPNRERGTAATEALAGQAVNAARQLLQHVRGGYIAASGNGVLVLYRLSTPVAGDFKGFEAKFKLFEEEMRRFLPTGVTLDATFDTARMVKLLGTTSTKGDRASWRYARFIDFPVVPYHRNDVLQRITANSAAPKQEVKIPSAQSLGYPSRSEAVFGLASFCKAKGISREAALAVLDADPFLRGRPDDNKRVIEKVFDSGQDQRPDKQSGSNREAEATPLQYTTTGKGKLDEHKKRLYNRKGAIPEMSLGLALIDGKTWGLRRGEIFTIAARPSIGKTSIAVNIAASLARGGKRVLFFTSEMSTDSTYDRLLQVLSGVPGDKFNTGNFTAEDRARLDVAYEELEGFGERLAVCDSTSPNIAQVSRTATQYQPDLLIYDHIQHIGGEAESGRAKVSQFVRGLKDVARGLNCAVLALSQIRRLYRDPKTGKEVRPTLSDLKESGTIEEESGAVMLFSILSDEPNNPVRCIYAELAKNRFGPLAVIGIEFDKLTDSWKDMESVEA